MLRLTTNKLFNNIELTQRIHHRYFSIDDQDALRYFDKDGFELTPLERVIYEYHGIPMNDHLNNHCAQQDWFVQDVVPAKGFVLDHSMILHRFGVGGALREQLQNAAVAAPIFSKILNIQPKWGLDFNLDYYDEVGPLELFHVEFDSRDRDEVQVFKERVEKFVVETEWEYVVERLRATQWEWQPIVGMKQNDWKARLLGFEKAELTQKTW